MSTHDLSIQQLEVVGGGRTILAVDRLQVDQGEALGVVGPNGAGKSTLLQVCLGLRAATRGRVTLLGRTVTGLGGLGLGRLRRQVGYVPQGLAAHSQMPLTVREVVAIGRTGIAGLFKTLRAADWQIIDDWIERLGLSALAGELYADLSGGEQRKALIARAMVQQPRVLMLDEPTAHLDLGWREEIVAALEQVYEQSRATIVMVCHELEALPRCCRRLLLLQSGRVLAEGSPEEVLTQERVASLYGPGLRVRHLHGRHAIVPGIEGGA